MKQNKYICCETHRPGSGTIRAGFTSFIAGLGTVISWALSQLGMTFPVYIGGMIMAIIMSLLLIQTVFMIFFVRFAVFHIMGRDYDAAVISAGACGLCLGATPTAMANMQTVCRKYKYSVKPFLILPIVGGVILDVINSLCITFFINIIK